MQYRMEGGSLPAVIINLNPGETMISEAGGRIPRSPPSAVRARRSGGCSWAKASL